MTNKTDTMSAKERIKGVMLNQTVDRVPFMPSSQAQSGRQWIKFI